MSLIKLVLEAIITFLLGTLVFDVVHYFFHVCRKSRYRLLRVIGNFHQVHHRFFSSTLKIEPQWAKKNILHHALVEYVVQMSVIVTCVLFINPLSVAMAAVFQTIIFSRVCYLRGLDPHHIAYTKLPAGRGGFLVNGEYHALHHIYQNSFFSSYLKLLDYVLGTGHHLRGKRIAITGANGALGSHMQKLLAKEGAKIVTFKFGVDYTYDDYEKLAAPLANTDILLLCHGSKYENTQQANCDSFVKIIEMYRAVHQRKILPPEVWAVGSEIECHPCFGIKKLVPYAMSKRNFAAHARKYFHDRDIHYRHLVHSAFMSAMGPGLMTASFAARMTLFLIKRDFKYVPVTYTGFAWLNYLRFMW